MNAEEYAAKKQRRIERLQRAADHAREEAERRFKKADDMASVIPFGQPILVGHYTEKADRNYRERIHQNMYKGIELNAQAKEYEQRAEAAENNTAISSDDPDATTKLTEKLAKLEQHQALMVAANKLIKKNDRAGLSALGLSDIVIAKLFMPDFAGRVGFPDYEIRNNGANIRTVKQRIEQLKKKAAYVTNEMTIGDVRLVANAEENRLQIFFPGKPVESIRSQLKSNGFHWSPYNGCWQRQLTNAAIGAAKYILKTN